MEDDISLWLNANFRGAHEIADEDNIFAAFGKFIAAYALAEAGVHIATRFFSKMSETNARFVFSGSRGKDIVECLRQFTVEDSSGADINKVLKQFGYIREARNQFTHRVIEYDREHGLKATNRLTGPQAIVEPRLFGINELEDMTHDCRIIFGRLLMHCDELAEIVRINEIASMELFAPWRYTPPPPEKKPPPNPDVRVARKYRPRAFRGLL